MKATVVIPNLNGAGWLRDSIESVWAQTEQDFELIVVGQRLHRRKPRHRPQLPGPGELHPHRKRRKHRLLPRGVNQGIRAAKGEFVALFNNDAFAEPGLACKPAGGGRKGRAHLCGEQFDDPPL